MNKKIFNNAGIAIIITIIIIVISWLCLKLISLIENPASITPLVIQILTWIGLISLFILLLVGIPFLIIGGILKNPEQKKGTISSDRYCPNCKLQIPLESRICPFCRNDFEKTQ